MFKLWKSENSQDPSDLTFVRVIKKYHYLPLVLRGESQFMFRRRWSDWFVNASTTSAVVITSVNDPSSAWCLRRYCMAALRFHRSDGSSRKAWEMGSVHRESSIPYTSISGVSMRLNQNWIVRSNLPTWSGFGKKLNTIGCWWMFVYAHTYILYTVWFR